MTFIDGNPAIVESIRPSYRKEYFAGFTFPCGARVEEPLAIFFEPLEGSFRRRLTHYYC